MKKETIFLIVVSLIVGGLVGTIFTKARKNSVPSSQVGTSAVAVDYQQNIRMLTGIVAKEPGNRNAWVQLGNNYFDSNQPMPAVEAYTKALELDGNDPDVLTDQGIMYRQIGWFDKAIENFTKASKLNPNHQNSLFNMGIVYSQDLGEKEKAKDAWTRYLVLVPSGQGADKVRTMIDHMETGHD